MIKTTLSPAIEAAIPSIYKLSTASATTWAAAVVVFIMTWLETGSTLTTKSLKAFLAIDFWALFISSFGRIYF